LSEFEKLKVVAKYELLKQIRRKRFYGVLVIVILAVVLTVGLYKGLNLPGRMGVPDNAEFFAVFVTSLSAFGVLGAVFFAGDAIASEFERKTGYILFPNPVKRTTLVAGKYLACFIATAIITIVAYSISAVALLVFYGWIPGGIIGSLAIALILSCFVISMAFTFSSVLKGGMGATIATLLTYMLILPIISSSLAYAGYNPWFMPDRAGDSMSATYNIPLENTFGGLFGGHGGGGFSAILMRASQDPTQSFLVLMIYAVILSLVSIWAANRKEMI
jgi:ABC-2 type transport system permease protein